MADHRPGWRLTQSPFGPLLLAIALALASTPLAMLAIAMTATDELGNPQPIDPAVALTMALVAVVAGALAGGSAGGLIVRRRPIAGLLLAVAVSWPVAASTLSVVPNLLGSQFYAVTICIDSCEPFIDAASPSTALWAYIVTVPVGLALSFIPVIGFVSIGWLAAKRGQRRLVAGLGLAAVVGFNAWSMYVGWVAAAALVVGAVLWVAPYWNVRVSAVSPSPSRD